MATDSESSEPKSRRRLFPRGFWLGLGVGAILMFVMVYLATDSFDPKVRIRLSGADVTRAGGVKIVLQDRSTRWTQACAGGCDDLQVLAEGTGENVFNLKIFNAAGDCIICNGIYVSGGNREDWHISGSPKLEGKQTFLERTEGGDKAWPAEQFSPY